MNKQRCHEVVALISCRFHLIAFAMVMTIVASTGGMVAADSADSFEYPSQSMVPQMIPSVTKATTPKTLILNCLLPRLLKARLVPLRFSVGAENGNTERLDGVESESRLNDLEKLKQIIQDEASKDEVPIDEYDREHWAYQPIEQPPIPTFGDDVDREVANWPSNAIDAFLLRRMLDAGLRPAPATDRVTLIRRLSFDLTGLPPSLEEVDRFVN